MNAHHEGLSPKLVSAALRNAFPYLRLFQNKVFVVKVGGEAFVEPATRRSILEQVSILERVGIRVVLVHGGGPQISALCERLDVSVSQLGGRRITDAAALEATALALNGDVNTRIVADLGALGTQATGISGVDAGLVAARRHPPVRGDDGQSVDLGEVGAIDGIQPRVIEHLLDGGFLPVVSPLGADADGALLNINADRVATALAVALGAEKLIFLTGAPGILEDPEDPASLVSYTDAAGLAELRDAGHLRDGMLPKTGAILAALDGGVARIHVISHRLDDSLLVEIFTNEGCGTLVVADRGGLRPEERVPGAGNEQVPT